MDLDGKRRGLFRHLAQSRLFTLEYVQQHEGLARGEAEAPSLLIGDKDPLINNPDGKFYPDIRHLTICASDSSRAAAYRPSVPGLLKGVPRCLALVHF